MSDTKFTQLAHKTLYLISELIEQQDPEGNIDIEAQDGMLKIEVTNRVVTDIFIINKNSAAREIWLSSPISGPHHFAYQNSKWKTRKGEELFSLLELELKIKFPHAD